MKLDIWAKYILQYANVSLMQEIIWITILVSMLILLYNILLPINHYISSIPINVIAKTLNNIRKSDSYFIRSLGHCISPQYCIRSSRYF